MDMNIGDGAGPREIGVPEHVPPGETTQPEMLNSDADGRERLVSPTAGEAKRRVYLMTSVAIGAVAVVGLGVSALSPSSPLRSHGRVTTVRTVALVPPAPLVVVAPAAKMANKPTPVQTPIVRSKPVRSDAGQDMALLQQMGGHSNADQALMDNQPPGTVAPTRAPSPVVARVAAAPAAIFVPTRPANLRPAVPLAVAPPPAPKVIALAAPASTDPADQAVALRAEPMTQQQQLDVLQLVTKLGTLVRDQRIQLQELRTSQQDLQGKVTSSVDDFGRRLMLAEARGSVAAAMGATAPALIAVSAPTAGPVPAAVTTRQQRPNRSIVTATVTAPPADTAGHRYVIQAASPGLAMLSELDAAGGDEQQVPVVPGDSLPGYGKVVSIAQRGSGWYVKTDHGTIQ